MLINLRKYENRARIHFIPDMKVGVFVTLRAPDVIKEKAKSGKKAETNYSALNSRFHF